MYNSGKKILHLCMSGKKILSPEVWETNYYPKQITHSPIPPNPQQSNDRPLRTFLSARLAHNVLIASLPAYNRSVLKAVVSIYSNGLGKANQKIQGKTQSPKGASDTFNIQEKRY